MKGAPAPLYIWYSRPVLFSPFFRVSAPSLDFQGVMASKKIEKNIILRVDNQEESIYDVCRKDG
jgi:hypothetical protein